jgi:hypothetical protein
MFLDEKKVGEDKVTLEPWRKALLDAADYIEEHGWCQGSLTSDGGRVCAGGAVLMAHSGSLTTNYPLGSVPDKAIYMLEKYVDASHYFGIASWNDAKERTKGEVVAAMRGCATTFAKGK